MENENENENENQNTDVNENENENTDVNINVRNTRRRLLNPNIYNYEAAYITQFILNNLNNINSNNLNENENEFNINNQNNQNYSRINNLSVYTIFPNSNQYDTYNFRYTDTVFPPVSLLNSILNNFTREIQETNTIKCLTEEEYIENTEYKTEKLDECSICFAEHDYYITIKKCKHNFCEPCIKKWLLNSSISCPTCRCKLIENENENENENETFII